MVCASTAYHLNSMCVQNTYITHTADADGASEQLKGLERLAEHDSHTDDDNHSLSGVGNGLSHGRRLLDRHRRELVVAVEPKACIR